MIPRELFPCVMLTATILMGCGAPAVTVEDAPFREAIGRYLQANNMALKIKEIKQGPIIEGEAAELKAAMTHEQLGGPSVTWQFQFAKQPDGSWQVTSHKD